MFETILYCSYGTAADMVLTVWLDCYSVKELRNGISKEFELTDEEKLILCVDCASDAVPVAIEDTKRLVKF